ncbi:MAG TPA: phosphopantetheine-binding protein [Bacteroidales bacterium]|jgi:acyl carrier protein|nr:acyl carrier protein [Bacteroidales bacterium]MDX9907423.1 phosphopantetheine-binding protein [Bacteroidales bacterium]HNQ84105.1 phosphopantetheine-binding protein [Bacteroidales bacterium]HOX78902.1 phosphopantetheine-binding protein [Bacteroidales bacterium]HPI85039.1 phosphopantetheine-binding protein [Bacteroidales bacterium]
MIEITDEIRSDVREIVCQFFAEQCEVEIGSINDQTNIITDLEGDSLMFLELIEIFKKKYNLDIELKTVGKYVLKHPVETIGQLIETQLLMIQYGNQILEMK